MYVFLSVAYVTDSTKGKRPGGGDKLETVPHFLIIKGRLVSCPQRAQIMFELGRQCVRGGHSRVLVWYTWRQVIRGGRWRHFTVWRYHCVSTVFSFQKGRFSASLWLRARRLLLQNTIRFILGIAAHVLYRYCF